MDIQGYLCFKCSIQFLSYKALIRHLKVAHPYLSKYECKQGDCERSYQDLSGLRKHYAYDHSVLANANYKKDDNNFNNIFPHNILDSSENSHISVDDSANFESDINDEDFDTLILEFVSKLYSNPSLSRNIVQQTIDTTEELVDSIFTLLQSKLLPLKEVNDVQNTFKATCGKVAQSFKKLKTEFLRLKHLETAESFIRPKPFYIGERSSLTQINSAGAPNVSIRNAEGQKICLKQKFKKFLELPGVYNDIMKYVENETSSQAQDILTSVYQGNLWKNVQTHFTGKVVLPILLFFDDFEPCNPLGSRAGIYKIGATYVSLACTPPQYASLLDNILLAQLFFSSDRTSYGNLKVFSKLIDELKFLEQEGITVCTADGDRHVYFVLFLILGDNLGLNSILGFTEGFNSDFYCRLCIAHKNICKVETNEHNLIPRTVENYELDSTALSHGVKESCIWHQLSTFHIAKNISCDLMHDLLEGVLRYDMAFLIDELIKKKYFTLDHLNNRIKFFKFSRADIGNPMPQIKGDHLKKKHLIMSASEMLSLTAYFGILVGDLIPEDEPVWNFYALIFEILEILLGRSFSSNLINYLEILIKEHHTLFCQLFNEHLRPKYHFMLHYTRLIKEVGPPRNIWCMRYEAYHKLLKSTASVVTCKKNLLVTLFIKDSLRFSNRLVTKKGFSDNIEVGPVNRNLQILNTQIQFDQDLNKNHFTVPWICINTVFLKLGFVVQITDEVVPDFGQIQHIIVNEDKIFLVLSKIQTVRFIDKMQAFQINLNVNENFQCYLYEALCNRYPYNIHYTGDGRTVICII